MSFSAAAVSRFARQIVAASTAAFPTVVNFRGVDITIKLTSVKVGGKLEDGGVAISYDAVGRIGLDVLAAMPEGKRAKPAAGETLTVVALGTKLRIETVGLPVLAPEYVINCMAS